MNVSKTNTADNIYIQRAGASAPAIVFVHGNSMSSGVWQDQMQDTYLQSKYHLIAIDLPGHGNSYRAEAPAKEYGMEAMGEKLNVILDQLNIEEYIIVALSLGASIVAEMNSRPKHCKGLFFIGASVINKDSPVEKIFLPLQDGAALARAQSTDEQICNLFREMTYALNEDKLNELISAYRQADPAFRNNMAGILTAGAWSNEIENLHLMQLPVAFIYGEGEKVVNPHYIENVQLPIWKDRPVLINAAGHLANIDQPAIINRLVTEFAEECFITSSPKKS